MMIKKKERFESKRGKVYEIAGKWGRDYVLSPVNKDDDSCLVYSNGEMEEFIRSGDFKRLGGRK
jgi:hypothetical protein